MHVTVKQPYYMVGISFPQQHALSMVTFKSRGIDCFPPKVPEWANCKIYDVRG